MPLTPDAVRAFRSVSVNRTPLKLLTVAHLSFGTYRFCSNTVPIVSRGNTYTPAPFHDVPPPPSLPGQIPAVEFVLGVNDQEFVARLRGIDESPTLTLELILAEDPDVVQHTVRNLTIEEAEMGVLRLRVQSGAFRIFQVTWPKLAYTPDRAPGVFV